MDVNTRFSIGKRLLSSLMMIVFLLGLLAVQPSVPPTRATAPQRIEAVADQQASPSNALTVQSGGQTLSFQSGSWVMTDSTYALRVEFINANPAAPQSASAEPQSTTAADTQTPTLPALTTVSYANLWNGIDLSYDAPSGSVARSTYTLRPWADPSTIRLRYNAPLTLSEDGSLLSRFDKGQIHESKPIAWQEIAGQRKAVEVAYQVDGQEVGFTLGAYDPAQTLFIDPSLIWTTWVGSGVNGSFVAFNSLVVDSSGNIFGAGYSNLPTLAGSGWGGTTNYSDISASINNAVAFVVKINASGNTVWSTFLGLPPVNLFYITATALALGPVSGDIYVYGTDGSSAYNAVALNTSTYGTPLDALGTMTNSSKPFLARLNPDGTMKWYTYLGPNFLFQKYITANGMALDASENIYLTGLSATSWNQGSTPPLHDVTGGGGFVAKYDSAGAYKWHTFLGTSPTTVSTDSLVIDSVGNIFVAGSLYGGASGTNWLNVSVSATMKKGYIARLDSSGNLLTNVGFGDVAYLNVGDNSGQGSSGLEVDPSGNLYVFGQSDSWGTPLAAWPFTTQGPYIAKFDSNLNYKWHAYISTYGASGNGAIYDVIVSKGMLTLCGMVYGFLKNVPGNTWLVGSNSYGASAIANGYVLGMRSVDGAYAGLKYTGNNTSSGTFNAYDDCRQVVYSPFSQNFFTAGKAFPGAPDAWAANTVQPRPGGTSVSSGSAGYVTSEMDPGYLPVLSGLSLGEGSLSPTFVSQTVEYNATVATASTSITVTPSSTELFSDLTTPAELKVRVNGGAWSGVLNSGSTSASLALNMGYNTVDVSVYTGSLTNLYRVNVLRPSNNANLSSMVVSGSTLSPTFAAATTSYTASFANSSTITAVVGNRADSGASLQYRVNGGSYQALPTGQWSSNITLPGGNTTIDVLVTAQDGVTTKTYTITATRAMLAWVTLNAPHTLTPVFSETTYSYTSVNADVGATVKVTAGSGVAGITLEARVNNAANGNNGSWSSLTNYIAANVTLADGANTIEVRGTSGTNTQTYSIAITQNSAANANLSGLTLSAGTLNETFAAGTTAYTSTVSNATTSTTVTATREDPGATLRARVNGGSYTAITSGTASGSLSLNVGANPIDIEVTSQNTLVTKVYTLTVTRLPSTDATLSALSTNAGAFTPSFSAATYAYSIGTAKAYTTTSATVTATRNEPNATLEARTNGGAYSAITSGTASSPLTLEVGPNTIDVRVTAQDGTTKQTYSITVTRNPGLTPPADATYYGGQNVDFTVLYTRPVTVNTTSGIPSIALSVGDASHTPDTTYQAEYFSGSGTASLVFRWPVAAGAAFDNNGIGVASTIVLNGGTMTDSTGNALLVLPSVTTTGVQVLGGLTLTINTNGFGTGTVTANPLPTINSAYYLPSDVVSLTPHPDILASPNSRFVGWSGDLTGTSNPGSVTTSVNKTVTAWFDLVGQVRVDPSFGPTTPGWGVTRFATVQSALQGAQSGDKVVIPAGTYNEAITLPDPGGPSNITLAPDTGVKFGGTFTQNGGTLLAPTGTLTFGGSFIQTGGSFDPNGGTVVFDGSNPVITSGSGGPLSFNNLTMAGTGTLTSTNPFGVTGTTTLSSGALNPASGTHFTDIVISSGGTLSLDPSDTIYVSGNWSNSGTFTPSGGTVIFDGTGTQTIAGTAASNFANLTVNSGSALVVNSGAPSTPAPSVTNTLSVQGSFNPPTGTNLKDVVIANGATLTAPTGNLNVSGNWTNDGAFSSGSGTVTFNGTGDQTIGGINSSAFNNLTINNSGASSAVQFDTTSVPPTPAPSVAGTLTVSDGIFKTVAGSAFKDITIATGAELDGPVPAGAISLSGTWTNNGTFTANNGTVSFNGAGAQEIKGSTKTSFYDLTVNKSGGTLSGTSTLAVTHDLEVISGAFAPSAVSDFSSVKIDLGATLTAPAGNINVSGNWTNDGTFTPGTGKITFNGTSPQTIAGSVAPSFYNLSIANPSTAVTLGSDTLIPNVSGTLEVVSGSFSPPSGANLKDVIIDLGATLVAPTGNFNVSGNWTNNGSFTPGSTGSVTFNGSSPQTLSGDTSFNDLNLGASATLRPASGVNISLGGSLSVTNGGLFDTAANQPNTLTVSGTTSSISSGVALSNLIILNGATLNAPSGSLAISGYLSNDGTFVPGTGTLVFNGSGAQPIGGSSATVFNNLTVANTSASAAVSFDPASPAPSVGGTLSVNDGLLKTVDGAAFKDITIASGAELDGPLPAGGISLSGTWTNNGTFTANSGVVTFNGTGAQEIKGSSKTSFYDLSVDKASGTLTGTSPLASTHNLEVVTGTFTPAASSDFASVKIDSGATLTAPTGSVSVSADWTNNGTFTPGTGTVNFNGSSAQAIAGTANFANLTLSNPAGVSSAQPFAVSDTFTLADGSFAPPSDSQFNHITIASPATLVAPSGSLKLSGDWTNNGTFTPGSGTVVFNGGTDQMIAGSTQTAFNALTVDKANSSQLDASTVLTTSSVVTIQNGALNPASGSTLDSLVIASGGSFALTDPRTLSVTKDVSNSGSFSMAGGTLAVGGSFDNASGGAYSASGGTVTLASGSFTNALGASYSASGGTLTLTDGSFINYGNYNASGSSALNVGGAFNNTLSGTISASGGAVNVKGSLLNANLTAGAFNPSGGTFTLNGSSAQSIIGSGFSFASLSFNNAAGVSALAAFTVKKDFELVKGSFNPPSQTQFTNFLVDSGATFVLDNNDTVKVAGSFNNQGTYTPKFSTLIFNGSASQTIDAVSPLTLRNLVIDNSSSASPAVSANVAMTVTSALTVKDGEYRPADASNYSTVLIEATGVLGLVDPNTITVYTSLTNNGSFAQSGGLVDVWGTVVNNGTFAPTGGSLSAGQSFTNALGSTYAASGGDVTVLGDLINAGLFTPSGGSLSLYANLNNTGIYSATGTSVVTVDGSTQQQITGITPSFAALALNNPAGLVTTPAITVTGTFDLNAGSFNPASGTQLNTVNIHSGTTLQLDPSDTLKVAGDINNSGTFTPAGSTLVLNGTGPQTVGGSVPYSFSNLVIENSGSGAVTTALPVTVSNDLIVTSGNFHPPASSAFHNARIETAGTLTAPNGSFSISGNWSDEHVVGSGFVAGSGSVILNGSGIQTLSGGSIFNDLAIGASSTLQMAANSNLGFSGQLAIAPGGTIDTLTNPGNTLSLLGDGTPHQTLPDNFQVYNLLIGPSAILDCPVNLSVAGNWVNNNPSQNGFNPNGCTVTFNGTGPQTIGGISPTDFAGLIINNQGGTVTAQQPITTTAPLEIKNGTFDPADGSTFPSVVIDAGGAWIQTSGETVNVTGDFTNNGDLKPNGGTLIIGGSLINGLTGTINPTGGLIDVTGDLNNDGSLAPSGGTINIGGDLNNHVGGSSTPTGGTINLVGNLVNDGSFGAVDSPPAAAPQLNLVGSGPNPQVIGGGHLVTLIDLQLNNPAGATTTDPITVTGLTTIVDGEFIPTGGSSFGGVTVEPGALLTPPPAGGLLIQGPLDNQGTIQYVKLDIQTLGNGSGTIDVIPAANYFVAGDAIEVTLTANQASGSVFSGWSGALNSSAAQIKLSMTSARSITASFLKVAAPSAVSETATGISANSVTLHGSVNAQNIDAAVSFEYGLTSSYGASANASPATISGAVDTPVSLTLNGLLPNTTYHFRVVAVNTIGTTYSLDQTFKTGLLAPTIPSVASQDANTTSVTLAAMINAQNSETTVSFEGGLTTDYGYIININPTKINGVTDTTVTKVVNGLAPNTTYHYRVVAVNAAGTTYSPDQTFTTSAQAASVTVDPVTDITRTGATLHAKVNAYNSETTVTIEYGLTTSYGSSVSGDPNIVNGQSDTLVSKVLSDLAPFTTYHFRIVATNSTGSTYGPDMSFTTLAIKYHFPIFGGGSR